MMPSPHRKLCLPGKIKTSSSIFLGKLNRLFSNGAQTTFPGLSWSLSHLLAPLGDADTRERSSITVTAFADPFESHALFKSCSHTGTTEWGTQINKPGKKIIFCLPKHPEIHDLER